MASYSYCYKCSILLREKDFERGKAFRVGENVACAACAPPSTPSTARPRPTSVRVRAAEPPTSDPPPPRRGPWILLGAGGLGVAALVVVILLWFLPKDTPPPPKAVDVPRVPPAPEIPPRERAAREALKAAKALDDPGARIRGLEEIGWAYEGTAAAAEARRELESERAKRRERFEAALAALDEELARDDIGPALARLEAVAKRHDAPEWNSGLAKRRAEVESKASALLPELARKAVELKSKGEDPAAIVARVESWSLPRLLEKLKAELEAAVAAPPPPKPPSPEAQVWETAWRAAAAKAAARDVDAALADLKKAADALKDDDVRKEAAGDVDELRALAALLPKLWKAASELPPGKAVKGGVIVRNGPERAELSTPQGPAYVEWKELGALALSRFARPEDAPALALLALLEGDVEGAKTLAGERALPAKATSYAAGAKRWAPAPDPARELFYAAEREFASMETRGAAVEKYRSLRDDYATSSVVRADLERILRRAEAGKEYLLTAGDARVSGTFRRGKDGAVSTKDSDDAEALENAVELEFYAMPGTSYRAWLQVGGCCREVLTFYLQGSEMTASEKGKRVPIDPGTTRAETVIPSLSGLKKEHREHAKNKEPKAPARWDWLPLALPKYAAPGPKKIRVMTTQQGFGVRAALISSSRTAPPKPAELEELLKARAADVVPLIVDPDLVLHWSFDEASGAFEDGSPYGFRGMSEGGVKRQPGKLGAAAVLDGSSGRVHAADAPELRVAGDLTLAFWVRKDVESKDWARIVGKGMGELRNFGVWETPGEDKKILFQIYKPGNGVLLNVTSRGDLAAGVWTHVACVRKGRSGLIYFDGRLDTQGEGEDGPPAVSADPLDVGFGPHGYFPGAVDDLRVYRRALSAEEIQGLRELGR